MKSARVRSTCKGKDAQCKEYTIKKGMLLLCCLCNVIIYRYNRYNPYHGKENFKFLLIIKQWNIEIL